MRLQHIAGNSYYINYPSIVGLYKFNDNSCLLIDSGASKAFGARTMKILTSRGLKVHSIINTHFHADHSGGNQIIQNETNCHIYASRLDKIFLEIPILSPYGIYSAYPIKPLQNKFLMPDASIVTHEIAGESLTINGEAFKIIDLSGHTLGQVGVVTPDGVLFVGDAIISEQNLEKFPFLYLANLEYHLNTMERLRNTSNPYVVTSHGGLLKEWRQTIDVNEEHIESVINLILDELTIPLSREAILALIVKKLDLPINTSQYFLISASVSAYLTYLHTERIIRSDIVDEHVKFIAR